MSTDIKTPSEPRTPELELDELSALIEIPRNQIEQAAGDADPNAIKQAENDARAAEKVAARQRRADFKALYRKAGKRGGAPLVIFVLLLGAGAAGIYFNFENKLSVMRFPPIEGINKAEHDELKRIASIDPAGVGVVAIAVANPGSQTPSLFLSSNKADSIVFDAQVKGVSSTLLYASSASVSLPLALKEHLASAPLRLKTGEALPAGKYKIEIYPPADPAAPDSSGSSAPSATQELKPIAEKELYLLGGLTQEAYEAKRKEVRDRYNERANGELSEISSLSKNMLDAISASERDFKDAQAIPIAGKKALFWKRSEPGWKARQAPFSTRFDDKQGPWKPEALKKRYLYPTLIIEARSQWQSIAKLRAMMDAFFTRPSGQNRVSTIAEAAARCRDGIGALMSSVKKAEEKLSSPSPEAAPAEVK